MAPKGYPGLVVVPPSARWVLRRQLAHWTFIVLAVVWSVSPSKIWVPSSHHSADCQSNIREEASASALKECGQGERSETEKTFSTGEFAAAEASQGGSLAGLLGSASTFYTAQLVTRHDTSQNSISTRDSPVDQAPSRKISTSPRNDLTQSSAPKKAVSSPNPDVRLAEQGDAFAQYRLGRFYAQISGPKAPESVSWYVKASDGLQRMAEAGNGQAMYVLGVMYAYGRGVGRDEEQARLWLTQAVERQIPAADTVLAKLDGH